MKLSKLIMGLAVAGLASFGAQAQVPYTGSLYTGAGTSVFNGWLNGVTGVDIYSNGSAALFCDSVGGCAGGTIAYGAQMNPAAANPLQAGDVIKTLYQGVVNVINPGVPASDLIYPGSTATVAGGGYQLTVAAILYETVVFGFVNNGVATVTLTPRDGGQVGLFYDSTDASTPKTLIGDTSDIGPGLGYTDGIVLGSGALSAALSLPTTVNADGTKLSGSANLGGLFSFVQAPKDTQPYTPGFDPAPHDFESTTTLQFGPDLDKAFQTVGFFDNANGWTRVLVNKDWTLRADANVDLTKAAPEPGSLALIGLAFAGLGLAGRAR